MGLAETIDRPTRRDARRQLTADERFLLASSVDDVETAHASGRLAVAFDLEDANPLDGRLELVERYHQLGIRTLVPTYNYRNAAGSGCMDAEDEGLTAYGRAMVREMNRVGMVPDGSHSSIRTGLDLCDVSTGPVIYSHTCMRSLRFVEPEALPPLAAALTARGYPDETITGILGGNFMRVARQAWNPAGAVAGPVGSQAPAGDARLVAPGITRRRRLSAR